MCVVVQVGDVDARVPTWDPNTVTLTVSDQLTPEERSRHVRAMLIVLGGPKCQTTATCWCGEPVALAWELGTREFADATIGATTAVE